MTNREAMLRMAEGLRQLSDRLENGCGMMACQMPTLQRGGKVGECTCQDVVAKYALALDLLALALGMGKP